MANGTIVEGFVINRDAKNNPILRTSIGDLQVTSDVFLKTGSEVVFRVDTNVASLARILSVDGVTPQEYTVKNAVQTITQDTVSSTLPSVANTATQPAATALPARGNAPLLEAILLQLHPQATTLAPNAAVPGTQLLSSPLYAQLALLRAGSPIPLTLLDLKLPPLPVALNSIPSSNKLVGLLSEPPLLTSPPEEPQPLTTERSVPKAGLASMPYVPDRKTPLEPLIAQPTHEVDSPFAATKPLPAAPVPQQKPPAQPEVFIPSTLGSAAPPPQSNTTKPSLPSIASSTATIANEVVSSPEESATSVLQPSVRLEAKAAKVMDEMTRQLVGASLSTAPALPTVAHALLNSAKAAYAPYESAKPLQTLATATSDAPHAANVVEAHVIGHDADGGNILHTPVASFKLYTPQPLPTGTTLTFALEPNAVRHDKKAGDTPTVFQTLESDRPSLSDSTSFKPLQQAVDLLSANQPDTAREIVQRLPSLSAKLTNDMLVYLAAIKGGNIEDLLGKRPIRQLEQSSPELLKRLRTEINAISAAYQDIRPTQWLVLPIPLMLGQQVETLRLYVHPEAMKKPKEANATEGQRFILEANLSELGTMQFDGFVRKNDRRRSFDLVVRSVSPLEATLTQSIRNVFTSSMEAVRMHGQVVFQVGNQHFFHPDKTPSSGDEQQTILA